MTKVQTASKTTKVTVKKDNRTKQIAVRVTPNEQKKFSERAASQGKTESDLARELLLGKKSSAERTALPLDRAHVYGLCLTLKNSIEELKLADAIGNPIGSLINQFEVEVEQLQIFSTGNMNEGVHK